MNGLLKKAGAVIVSMALLFTLAFNLTAATTFPTAKETVSYIGVGINLGNTFECYGNWFDKSKITNFESAWGSPVTTKAMITSIKSQGFNAIRIPITWSQHIDSTGKVDSAWMARIKTVVDYAYDEGMYVIINVHHDNGPKNDYRWMTAETSNYTSSKTKFAGLWKNIATTFKDYDNHLLFEGYNEVIDSSDTWNAPSKTSSYTAINNYAQLFVDTVRATGGNNAQRNLIVNTYVASHDQACLDNFTIPKDSASNHLIVEVHVYHPWEFTGTSAEVNWSPAKENLHTKFNDSDKSAIDTILTRLKKFSDSKGVPVIIGEFGAMNKSNTDEIAKYAAYFVDAAGKKGIKCFYWDNGDKNYTTGSDAYAIFKRSTLTWRTSISSAMVNAAKTYKTAEPTPKPTSTPTPVPTNNPANPTATPTPVPTTNPSNPTVTPADQKISIGDKTATLSVLRYIYDGNSHKPAVSISGLVNGTDYQVSYPSDTKNVGYKTVTITGIGNYTGTLKVTYKISPKSTSISKLYSAYKGFTVKWKKQSTQVTGYQIQYSTSSSFKSAKTVTITKTSTVSKKVTKLKRKKKYYVRVRTYKTVNGVKFYSDWSSAKSIKTR